MFNSCRKSAFGQTPSLISYLLPLLSVSHTLTLEPPSLLLHPFLINTYYHPDFQLPNSYQYPILYCPTISTSTLPHFPVYKPHNPTNSPNSKILHPLFTTNQHFSALNSPTTSHNSHNNNPPYFQNLLTPAVISPQQVALSFTITNSLSTLTSSSKPSTPLTP